MKHLLYTITAAVAAMTALSCANNTADVEIGPFTVYPIQKNVYHIQDYNSSNPAGETLDAEGNVVSFNNCSDIYLINGKNKALLIDLSNKIGWADNAEESLRQLVAERTDGKELIITFTHNHGDHTGMLKAYTEDPDVHFALPEADFTRLAGRFPENQYSFINEGHIFDLGGIEVEVISVPGHTNGSVVFYIHGQNILFTGDAIGSGHGVWIFNEAGYKQYVTAIPHLISWLENPENKVDIEKLRIYGGHYWQRNRLPDLGDDEMGISYLRDMQALINDIASGKANSEPSSIGRPNLDTYFKHGIATIAWNAEEAKAFAENL